MAALKQNYLGVDWGEKRIGLALGFAETKMALPFKTVSSLGELLAVIKAEEIEVIVLGNPQKLSGERSDNRKWLLFYSALKEKVSLPLYLQDERLSSKAVDALIGSKKDKVGRDEMAAAFILQAFFDSE
ncbi:MAG: Holliday junction resolvase RuvX [Patescibacteria group bacterium]|nr:Holliday junction resolvase RuvX [Patescibacteria group bacterium]MDD3778245.1 Holliday junction resolvase RuvX [Patescibacteria group bacterium]MDD3939297.1 Holliday junction resolvase RuvX [Patescibacteria group bacterium]MDD4443935.1 Holliday junction resolvase RuvX [Patescibacteria group bacterium]NCU39534.1 Holliday junction resolvase RuvX [Candidatus Falkowbacteria bacterium]